MRPTLDRCIWQLRQFGWTWIGARGAVWALSIAITFCLAPKLRAQWSAIGPFGGPAALVQSDPNDNRIILAGTDNAMLYRSNDGGESWKSLAFPLQLRAVLHALAIHPAMPGLYLIGISPEAPGHSGLLRSTDAGITWQEVPAMLDQQVRAIAVFRGNSQMIAVGTGRGVFLSRDGGNNWDRISPSENRELQPVVSLAFDPNVAATIYAGTPHLAWKTVDAGATWRSIHTGMADDSDVFSLLVDRNRPRRVFVGACTGIYLSNDGGSTWAPLQGAESGYRTYTVVQDPQYENWLFVGTNRGMARSKDGGATWEKIAPYTTRSISFDLRQLGRIYIATDDSGILRSDDYGETWREVNKGFSNLHLCPLAMGDEGELYTCAIDSASGALFRLSNGSDEWSGLISRALQNPLISIAPSPHSPGTLYGATRSSVVVSIDAGQTWTRFWTPFEEGPLAALLCPAWRAGGILAAAATSVFVNQEYGEDWIHVRFPSDVGGIRALIALDPSWIAAISMSEVFLSSDGRTWNASARLASGTQIRGLALVPGRGLLAATSSGLWVSSDLGGSWQPTEGMFEGDTVQAICRHPVRKTMLFAARFGQIYASPDGGHSWAKISSESWPVTSIRQLVVVPGEPDRLFVLTQQQGVFVIPLSQ